MTNQILTSPTRESGSYVSRSLLAFALLLLHGTAYGQSDLRYITGLSLGYSQFEFPEKLDHEVSFPSANLLLAASLDQWQASLNSAFTLSDANVSEEEERGKRSGQSAGLPPGQSLEDREQATTARS